MPAIISELDEAAAVQVMRLWRRLNEACGLEGIFNFPNPHFTWFVAEEMDTEKAAARLTSLAAKRDVFEIHTFGMGLFSGERPVLYLPIVKSATLIEIHTAIWQALKPQSEGVKRYYNPDFWVPHITLALMDLTQENLTCALDSIAHEPIELFTRVDNLALVEQAGYEIGETLERFQLRSDQAVR